MNKVPKGSKNFECATCDYNTSRHSQYMRHLMTPKHKNRTNIEQKGSESSEAYKCECGKKYKARNSLWYHKQKCKLLKSECNENTQDHNSQDDFVIDKELIMTIMKQNHELQNQVMELL